MLRTLVQALWPQKTTTQIYKYTVKTREITHPWDDFPSRESPNHALRGTHITKMVALERFRRDLDQISPYTHASLGTKKNVCTFPIVEKTRFEVRSRGCVISCVLQVVLTLNLIIRTLTIRTLLEGAPSSV